jgi:hypothetical protein
LHASAIREWADLFRFSDDHHADPTRGELPFGSAYEMHREKAFDLGVFCLERHPSSDFAWAMLGVFPGVALLLEDQAPPAKPWLFQSGFQETTELRHGGVESPRLDDLEPIPVDAEERALLLAHSVVLGSEELLERIPGRWHPKCSVLPIPVASPSSEKTTAPPRSLLIGVPPTEDFAVSKILSALERCSRKCPVHWLVDDEQQRRLLHDRFASDALRGFELNTPQRTLESWQHVLATGGIAILLQTWGRQSLEPYLGTALVCGAPTIVSNFGLGRLLNDEYVLRIDIGLSLAGQLASIIDEILEAPESWDGVEQQSWAQSRYDLGQSQGELQRLLTRSASEVAPIVQRVCAAQRLTRARLRDAVWNRELSPWAFGDAFRESREFLESLG